MESALFQTIMRPLIKLSSKSPCKMADSSVKEPLPVASASRGTRLTRAITRMIRSAYQAMRQVFAGRGGSFMKKKAAANARSASTAGGRYGCRKAQ